VSKRKKLRLAGGEFEFLLFGGAERDRTVDLLNAMLGSAFFKELSFQDLRL